MEKPPVIRLIYLYLFALVGLALVTIGGVRLVDMALRATVFTQADEEQRLWNRQPPMMPTVAPKREGIDAAADRAVIEQWERDYEEWRQAVAHIDPVMARRQRDAASSIGMIAIGLPLYLFHWGLIRRQMTP